MAPACLNIKDAIMNRSLFLITIALAFSLSNCAFAETNEVDAKHIQTLQVKAEHMLAGKEGADVYGLAKARALLDLALDEFYEDDRTGIIQAAIAEGEKLLTHPESALPFSVPNSPQLPGSEVIRDDLWNRIATMHASPDFGCAARQLGQLEVLLNWAGHEKWESGWSHAKPYVEQAENQTYDAEMEIKHCAEKRLAEMPKPTPVSAAPAVVTIEKYSLQTDALFAFDQSGIEHLVQGGQGKLDKLIESLKTWKHIDTINVVGHTDRLGKDVYNDKLSLSRAIHVKEYLGNALTQANISASGMGERESMVQCRGWGHSKALISCLQPNRRVDIIVTGQRE
jgi:outer membrane protein OmpA-like peptidoglycan-associated protein